MSDLSMLDKVERDVLETALDLYKARQALADAIEAEMCNDGLLAKTFDSEKIAEMRRRSFSLLCTTKNLRHEAEDADSAHYAAIIKWVEAAE